jgi:hypothetical protein
LTIVSSITRGTSISAIPALSVFFNHAESYQAAFLGAVFLAQQFNQSSRQAKARQSAVEIAQHNVDVRQGQYESYRLAADLGDPRKLRHYQRRCRSDIASQNFVIVRKIQLTCFSASSKNGCTNSRRRFL